jgi:fluoroacetyl-CoA thioesterase
MPNVFATGFMVGLFEWACIRAIMPYLDYPQEQTVGIHVNFSHIAATPPGLTITVKGKLNKINGRKLSFSIEADDGVEKISEGTHDRFIINTEKFDRKVKEKVR